MKENLTRSKSLEEATAAFWEAWENRNKLNMQKKIKVYNYLRKQHGVEKKDLIKWMKNEFKTERNIALNMINALINQNVILETDEYCFPAGD